MANGKSSAWSHTNALFRKSLTYQKRQKGSNCCQLLTSVFVVLFILAIQAVVDDLVAEGETLSTFELRNPPAIPPSFVTAWGKGEAPRCVSIPNGPRPTLCANGTCPTQPAGVIDANIWVIAPSSLDGTLGMLDSPGSPSGGSGVLGQFDTTSPIPTFFGQAFPQFAATDVCYAGVQYAYPLTAARYETPASIQAELYNSYAVPGRGRLGGYSVLELDIVPGQSLGANYAVHFNRTLTFGTDVPTFSSWMASALLRVFSNGAVSMGLIGTKDFPRLIEGISVDIVTIFARFLYIYVFQLTLPVMLTAMVFEKEAKLLEIMRMMGLRISAYWVVTYVFNFLLYFISMTFFWILAAIAGFRFWTDNDPSIVFMVLFMWGHTMVAFVFFLRTLFSKTSTATVVGYLLIFASGLLSSQIYRVYLDEPETPQVIVRLFYLFPPMVLYRAILALANAVLDGGPGLEWGDINHPRVRLGEVFFVLFLEWAVFLVLAWYLDNVIKGATGIHKHPLFIFHKETYAGLLSYFKSDNDESSASALEDYRDTPIRASYPGEPDDVQALRTRVASGEDFAFRCADLDLTYPSRGGAPPKHAVKSSTLGIKSGEVFGLLGATGSGKTSLISLATGLMEADSGTAHISHHNIRTHTRAARMTLGVCPQHDLLWDDLTGPEHVRFYGRVKGLKGDALTKAVDDILEAVNLATKETRRKLSSEYSGGMKRRLSLACALVGNPDVVVLDEPTTGLDPQSKRAVWRVIQQYRTGSALLLTTHSMAEADALCDRIGIVVDGQMKAHGSVASLKSRFSQGYKLTTSVDPARAQEAHNFIMSLTQGQAEVLNTLATVRNYEVSRDLPYDSVYGRLSRGAQDHGILSWELTHSSMEEVFLNVVSQHWSNAIEAKKIQASRVQNSAGTNPASGVALQAFSSPSSSSSSSSSSGGNSSSPVNNTSTNDDAHGSAPKTAPEGTDDDDNSYYSSYVSE